MTLLARPSAVLPPPQTPVLVTNQIGKQHLFQCSSHWILSFHSADRSKIGANKFNARIYYLPGLRWWARTSEFSAPSFITRKIPSYSSFKWPTMAPNRLPFEIKPVNFSKRHLSLWFHLLLNQSFPPFPSMEIVPCVRLFHLFPPLFKSPAIVSNSSQTITTVRTSSSIDLQQQSNSPRKHPIASPSLLPATLTSDTTTLTTQQLTGIVHQPTIRPSNSILPTTIINGNNLQTYDHNSSMEESKASQNNLSLSLSQIAQKVSHRHRRSSR